MTIELTKDSKELFVALIEDAGNWGGNPLWDGNVEGKKGNLLDLKKKGLVTTFVDEGNVWVQFTKEGWEHAKELGIDDYYVNENTK